MGPLAGFLQNLRQCPHLFGFFQEESDGFLQILECALLGRPARGDVQFHSMGHECTPLFENPDSGLDFHRTISQSQNSNIQLIEFALCKSAGVSLLPLPLPLQ